MSVIPLLSVDGGGIRGIISGRVLEYLESRLEAPVQSRFYMSSGSSAGGLIVASTSLVGNAPILTAGEAKKFIHRRRPGHLPQGLSRTHLRCKAA